MCIVGCAVLRCAKVVSCEIKEGDNKREKKAQLAVEAVGSIVALARRQKTKAGIDGEHMAAFTERLHQITAKAEKTLVAIEFEDRLWTFINE